MKQATIDAKDFNLMVKNLKKVLRKQRPSNSKCAEKDIAELIHMEFRKGEVKCVATDYCRIHEEHIPAMADEEFVCHITPPRLPVSAGRVKICLEEFTAYVEFDDTRLSIKQPHEPIEVPDSEKVQAMIADDERFEVAINPKYLLDAVNTMRSEKYIILNVGDPLAPITLYPCDGVGTHTYSILPIQRRHSDQRWMDTSGRMEDERRKKLKAISKRLCDVLAHEPIDCGEQESQIWEKANSLKDAIDIFLGEEGDRT